MYRRLPGALLALALTVSAARGDDPAPGPLTPWQLRAAVAKKPAGADLERLRKSIEATFGKKNLAEGGPHLKVQETLACWVYVRGFGGGRAPRFVQADGDGRWDMTPVGGNHDLFILFMDLPNCTVLNYYFESGSEGGFGGGSNRSGPHRLQVEHYNYGPDSYPQPGVPKGTVTKHSWKSKVFAGTERDYWVYVPAQYDPKQPACVMVFQDGGNYLGDQFRTATVFDNLIHKKEIPVLVGVFINPGVVPPAGGRGEVRNRSFEYDTLSDQYALFLRDEILPEVGKTVKLRDDPRSQAICGISSGGICAFTVAWQKPELFGKVLSHVGSFTNIRGGHAYPALIRKTPKKNIRVYLQGNEKDLDNEHGHWPLANRTMAAALKFKGYDYEFVMGPGFHSGKFGGAHLPEQMKWLWRDYTPADEKGP